MGKTKLYPWMIEHRHPIFLVGLLSFFILPEIIDKVLMIRISFPILISILIISSIMLIHTSSKRSILSYSLILVLIIFVIVWAVFENNVVLGKIAFNLLFIYFSFITYYLYQDLRSTKIINGSVVIGAFSGYFMIGVIFTFILAFLELSFPDTLSLDMNGVEGIQNTLYFSFITLTTIGYGDITPTSQLGHNFAILEGLIGQFYIAIVMATIVGKFISHSSKE